MLIRRLAGPRRGGTLAYAAVVMVALAGICSLAVDYGHVQAVKTDLQRCSDATARGALAIYTAYSDASLAQQYAPLIPTVNPVDAGSGVSPTVDIQWGTWNAATKTFTAGSFTSSTAAVKVTCSRTRSGGNPVRLFWAAVLGKSSCDVSATAVACCVGTSSVTATISGKSDPWLAGMGNGSHASYNDAAPSASPQQVTGIAVVPGSYITLTNVSGLVRHAPQLSDGGPDGSTTEGNFSHGADSPHGPTPAAENGIADVTMPIDALLGVFLDDNSPDTTAAPSARDYSTAAARDRSTYDDIQLKQPFFIGDGQTSGGAVQTFRVPPGATRLYLGVMDGYEWSNNQGSFTATINVIQSVSMVQ